MAYFDRENFPKVHSERKLMLLRQHNQTNFIKTFISHIFFDVSSYFKQSHIAIKFWSYFCHAWVILFLRWHFFQTKAWYAQIKTSSRTPLYFRFRYSIFLFHNISISIFHNIVGCFSAKFRLPIFVSCDKAKRIDYILYSYRIIVYIYIRKNIS